MWLLHSSDDDDSCDDVVAIIDMLRDHFAVSENKLTRSEQLRIKQEAFLDTRTSNMKQLTSALSVDSKCSAEFLKLSMKSYTSMSLHEASEGFPKLRKGIGLNEGIRDEDLDEEEDI